MSLLDGIQAARWLLQQDGTRFHAQACKAGLEALRAYHYEYDEDSRIYSPKPAHDWSSHTADAFRYAAVVTKASGIYRPRPQAANEPMRVHGLRNNPHLTLDRLFEERDRRPRERRIA
jgi:hypothetical protein